jgi:AcrR family transcriptional regulator
MEEHAQSGIAATSFEKIARRADVGIGTVYRHFPTLEDLVPACGAVAWEQMALPAPGQIPALFPARAARRARVERLVREMFGIYERSPGPTIDRLREERAVLPHLLEDGYQALEATLDALVTEGLRPLRASDRDRALVRALLDWDTWKALRAQGITGEDAITAAAGVVSGVLARGRRSERKP